MENPAIGVLKMQVIIPEVEDTQLLIPIPLLLLTAKTLFTESDNPLGVSIISTLEIEDPVSFASSIPLEYV